MTNKPFPMELVGLIATFCCALPAVAFAVEPTVQSEPLVASSYQLVFSDDFSTDPNSNGNWTVFRALNDPTREGYWDPTQQVWYLTTHWIGLATAAFANYELTATSWKVDFKYLVDHGFKRGGDGFVFMFYKDKSAYRVRPADGQYMAFETLNRDFTTNPVPGYGLEFDTYYNTQCDPLPVNYVAIVKDVICESAQVYRPFKRIGDNVWHSVEFTFKNGLLACTIDGNPVLRATISDPDYSHAGIGFGAATANAVSNQAIDDFEIWIENNE